MSIPYQISALKELISKELCLHFDAVEEVEVGKARWWFIATEAYHGDREPVIDTNRKREGNPTARRHGNLT